MFCGLKPKCPARLRYALLLLVAFSAKTWAISVSPSTSWPPTALCIHDEGRSEPAAQCRIGSSYSVPQRSPKAARPSLSS